MVIAADVQESDEPVPRLLGYSVVSSDVSPASCDAVTETHMSSSALKDDVSAPVSDKSDTDITVAVTSM